MPKRAQYIGQINMMYLNPHCRSRNYATPRLSAEVAFVRPEKEQLSDWLV
jgi:hypothetical protein